MKDYKMSDVTFVIFTYNEEKRIEKVIQNFKDFGKILIADNRSTDKTVEIAYSYGCDVFIREQDYAFVENQHLVNLLYEKVSTNWIYWAFADEMLDITTLVKIKEIISIDKYDIINIDRKNYYYGTFCYNLYHARTNKIFKKGAIDFTNNVIHGMGTPIVSNEKIYKMPDKYFVHHFISNTASSYLNVMNSYTETELLFGYTPNRPFFYLLFQFIKAIFKNFFLDKGYKAGTAGIALTQMMMFYFLLKNMKLYEQVNGLNRNVIEEKNNFFRDKILKQF